MGSRPSDVWRRPTAVAVIPGVAAALLVLTDVSVTTTYAAGPDSQDSQTDSQDAPKPEPGELSEQGHRRGALQFGVAALLTGTSVGLVAVGVGEFVRAQAHLERCRSPPIITSGPSPFEACSFDPPTLGFTSAGLSWGLAIPAIVGAGLLFARGAAISRDARRHRELSTLRVYPWAPPRTWGPGAGLGLSVEF